MIDIAERRPPLPLPADVTWRGREVTWTPRPWLFDVIWWPRAPAHPACDPRNPLPPGGWQPGHPGFPPTGNWP